MTKLISLGDCCHKILEHYLASPSVNPFEDNGEVSVPEEGA
jgi:hypothetical protein